MSYDQQLADAQREIARLQAALAAARRVPRVATKAMRLAGQDVLEFDAATIWRAMYDAAPPAGAEDAK